MFSTVLTTAIVMLALAGVMSLLLSLANVKLAVYVDPRQEEIANLMPQANCGGCGFASCSAYAKAVHEERAAIDLCTVGGPDVTQQLAGAMGVEVEVNYPFRPVIHCAATTSDRLQRGRYFGEPTCAAANVVGGVQGCAFGCLGFGDCVVSCEYDAMAMADGLPQINYENCIGCGACVRSCPRNIIEQIPYKTDQMLVVACASHDPAKRVRDVCKVGCIGCSLCARVQPELFHMEGELPVLDYDAYSEDEDFTKAVEKCPRDSLVEFGPPPKVLVGPPDGENGMPRADRPDRSELDTTDELSWRG